MKLWFFETKSLFCSSTWVEAAPIKFYFNEIFFWNNFSELFRKWWRLMWRCQNFLKRFETYAHPPILKSRDLGSIEYIVRKSETYLWWFPQQPWFTFSRLEMSRSLVVHINLLQIHLNIQRWNPGGIKIYGSLFHPIYLTREHFYRCVLQRRFLRQVRFAHVPCDPSWRH